MPVEIVAFDGGVKEVLCDIGSIFSESVDVVHIPVVTAFYQI